MILDNVVQGVAFLRVSSEISKCSICFSAGLRVGCIAICMVQGSRVEV